MLIVKPPNQSMNTEPDIASLFRTSFWPDNLYCGTMSLLAVLSGPVILSLGGKKRQEYIKQEMHGVVIFFVMWTSLRLCIFPSTKLFIFGLHPDCTKRNPVIIKRKKHFIQEMIELQKNQCSLFQAWRIQDSIRKKTRWT